MLFRAAEEKTRANIKVIGVGGAGGNAVNSMIEHNIQGVEFLVANTDCQDLNHSRADKCIQIGRELTRGLGAGANAEVGKMAAEESTEALREALEGADMVFIAAGLGGGTGTGAAPVIARVCRQLGALTIGVVTKPFPFEGAKRTKNALSGWQDLKQHSDTVITIANGNLLTPAAKKKTFADCLKDADQILVNAVKGIADLINLPGYINPDFADIKTVMQEMGPALIGMGAGVGAKRAGEAVKRAVACALLENASIKGAKGIVMNISARTDTLQMDEVMEASDAIHQVVHKDANIIFGVIFDDNLGDEMRVTVVATGIQQPQDVEKGIPAVKDSLQSGQPAAAKMAPQQGHIFQRQQKNTVGAKPVRRNSTKDLDTIYEIPAFLRQEEN